MIYNNIIKNGTHILIYYYDDRKIYTNLEYNKFIYEKNFMGINISGKTVESNTNLKSCNTMLPK